MFIVGWIGLPGVWASYNTTTPSQAKARAFESLRDAYPGAKFTELRVMRDLGVDPPPWWPRKTRPAEDVTKRIE